MIAITSINPKHARPRAEYLGKRLPSGYAVMRNSIHTHTCVLYHKWLIALHALFLNKNILDTVSHIEL